jgi:hypothetical protein
MTAFRSEVPHRTTTTTLVRGASLFTLVIIMGLAACASAPATMDPPDTAPVIAGRDNTSP